MAFVELLGGADASNHIILGGAKLKTDKLVDMLRHGPLQRVTYILIGQAEVLMRDGAMLCITYHFAPRLRLAVLDLVDLVRQLVTLRLVVQVVGHVFGVRLLQGVG